jgi:hypothetical protein
VFQADSERVKKLVLTIRHLGFLNSVAAGINNLHINTGAEQVAESRWKRADEYISEDSEGLALGSLQHTHQVMSQHVCGAYRRAQRKALRMNSAMIGSTFPNRQNLSIS